ncbi:FAD-dependent oxidoreductase, partial [Candidatus Fermentibacterales bacterium]|nr:FAD-dependent oxidoreductase [Candidatus Fermentibacterales bacterium]
KRSPQGFRFDLGPHRFHTQKPELLDRVRDVLEGRLVELERTSRIRLLDRYFHYPLSLGDVLSQMPLHTSLGIVFSYVTEKARGLLGRRRDENFRDWVAHRFGQRLYDIYFGPYTEKLWGCPSTRLSADWASQRISVPSLTRLVRETVFPGDRDIRSLVSTFHYPAGGIGRIAESFAARIERAGGRLLFGAVPRAVRRSPGGFLIDTDDEEIEVASIVSTIPVTDYVDLLGPLLQDAVQDAAEELVFRSLVFVAVRIRGRIRARDHWIYIPESKYLFNRLSIPENFDPDLPPDQTQLVFEFSCQHGDDIWTGDLALVRSAVEGGEALGLLSQSDVLDTTIERQSHAYPIYLLGYEKNVRVVLDALDDLPGSVTCGRQGLFRYNNMDHSIEMGQCAAAEILGSPHAVRRQFQWDESVWADG